MHQRFRHSLAFALLAVSSMLGAHPCLCIANDTALEKARQIQLSCEEYRQNHFNAGFMRLTIGKVVAPEVVRDSTTLSIWYDGPSLRNDGVVNGESFQHAVTNEFYTTAVGQHPVTVAPLGEYEDAKSYFGLAHPRWIGLGYNDLATLSRGTRFRCLRLLNDGWPAAAVVDVVAESLSGVETWKITCTRNGEFRLPTAAEIAKATGKSIAPDEEIASGEAGSPRVRRIDEKDIYWIAPEQGYALIRNERVTVYPDRGVTMKWTLDAQYELDPESETWYPRTSTTIERENDRIVRGTAIAVEEVSFAPPDGNVFTIENFNLERNRHIYDRTLGLRQQKLYWDGARAVRIPSAGDAVDLVVPATAPLRRWLLWGNALALALLAMYLLFRRGRV